MMEAKVATLGNVNVVKDYRVDKLQPININAHIKAYSVSFEDGLCFFGVLSLLTRGLNSTDT